MTNVPSGKRRRVKVTDVMEILGPIYGPVDRTPRYNAAQELVYTILSQHTSDVNSTRAYDSLMAMFESLDSIAAASPSAIEDAIRQGGLAAQKSVRIKTILNQVKAEVGSYDLSFLAEMPLDEAKAWLKRLPGVGPKTAAIILCFALGMPAMPVDTHVHRVSVRLGLIGRKVSADKAHDILEAKVPPDDVLPFHMYLIWHGRQVCKAQRPRCGECALAWGCPARAGFEKAAGRTKTGAGRPSQRKTKKEASNG